MVLEPGLDLHEWETRWQELQDLAAEAPAEAMPEIVRLIEQMLVERGYDLENPVVMEGEDVLPNSSPPANWWRRARRARRVPATSGPRSRI